MALFGPNGSHHNLVTLDKADWSTIRFMVWRASIGRTLDLTYPKWRDAARTHKMPFLSYHFVYPVNRLVNGVKVYTAQIQAATYARNEPDKTIPIMLDWEADGSIEPSFDDILQVTAALRALGYKVVFLYTGKPYWEEKGKPTLSGHGLELVHASWGSGNDSVTSFDRTTRYNQLGGDASTVWNISYGGLKPSMWQFSDRVRWSGYADDMNAIRDPAVFQRCFKHWGPALITAAPPPTLQQGSTNAVNVRWLQQVMNERFGTMLTVDGSFGNFTTAGVKRMQGILGTTVDGIYGPRTAAALTAWLDQH